MVNQQLLDYIKQQSQQGIKNDEIKKSLLASGWQGTDIEEAFGMAQISVQGKKRRWKKIILIIISFVILLVIAFLSLPRLLNLFAKDIAPIDDSDLSLKVVTVSDSDNAYFDLIKLDSAVYEPEGKAQAILDMIAGKIWDDKLAEEIISRNTQAFVYFAEAARKAKFQDPASADPVNITPNTVLPAMNNWRKMARLSAIRAIYLAKQGKDKEAMDEALNSVRIGQKIQESQAHLVAYLVAIAMKGVGLETIQKILITSKLSNVELKQYAHDLNQYYENENGLINSFKGEYRIQSWTIDAMASGNTEILEQVAGEVLGEKVGRNLEIAKKVKNNYYFQPNKTKLLFAENARVNIKNVYGPCGEIKATEVQKLTPANFAKLYIEENAIGKILHDVIATSLNGMSIRKCEEDLLVAATQALIGIKAYKNDTKNYPAMLSELAPNYLSSVPQDSFDGKLLKYFAEEKIVYSVGQDMQDSGGSTGDDWRKMPDPTFKIGF